jgi:nucleotide-binding universal stress UspA family protein
VTRGIITTEKISKILVAMDGSESPIKAYQYASLLAKQCEAALLIVNIFDTFERIASKIKQELGEIAKQIVVSHNYYEGT